MGMYDDIKVLSPLPGGSTTTEFQTKSLSNQLDNYELREDDTLWHEEYDIEDHSDPNATGIMRLAGIATRVNQRWVQVTDLTREIRFYTWHKETQEMEEYSTYWVDGKLMVGPIRINA